VTFTWVDFGVVLTGREILHFLDVVVITDEPLNKGKYCFLILRDLATLSGFLFPFPHFNLYCSVELPYKCMDYYYTKFQLATLPTILKFAIFKTKRPNECPSLKIARISN
jgi:hypothetical protein